ncbi:hypothetical protein RhiirA1_530429 [Rhizophagus irregularis]|uniref:Uncharacterized protein n=1 Tax=Rhizophagus irregularis TaxID=588596 RepID=A0A2N0SCX4_9GLOM|nr:hypothetical protein RhiirA1_530429 [Rhizophagus irregularis]
MSTELELLRQRISELETKNAKLEAEKAEIEARNVELLKQVMDENAKRDARVEELELKNTELEARLLMLEQGSSVVDGQSQNDRETIAKISAVDESDSVIDQQNDVNTKSMEKVPEVIAEQSVPDKVIDDFILEESVNVPDSVIAQPKQCIPPPIHEVYSQLNLSEVRDPGLCNQNGLTLTPQIEEVVLLPDQGGSLEDREMDAFLDEEQKGLDSVIPLNEKDGQDVYLASPSSESCVASPGFEYIEKGLVCELLEFIRSHESLPNSTASSKQIPVDSDLAPGSIPHLAHLFDKAEKTGRKEKLRWYYYSEEFEKKAITIALENNISDQMARTQIYNEMEPYLPGKKRENLRKVTQKAKNIYTLFKEIGIDKIGLVTYSVDAIGSLTGAQIQNIINLYTAECQKVISVKNSSRSRDLPAESNKSGLKKSPDVGKSTPPTSQTSKTNQTNVRVQSKPTYDRAYFRNKILDQYPNLYKECSCENFDYYGITDETSCGDYICPLCKLGHDDEEIEGEYKAGSYFIKCEQREIEITA